MGVEKCKGITNLALTELEFPTITHIASTEKTDRNANEKHTLGVDAIYARYNTLCVICTVFILH